MKKRKGFTIVETLIVIVVLSLILLTLFAVYGQFKDIKDQVDSVTKLKNFKNIVDNNLYDIKKVKEILKSVQIIDNDKNTETNNLKYFDNNNEYVSILEERKLSRLINNDINQKEALENFLGIYLENDKLFYNNVFVFYTTTKEKFLGVILGNYKKFTFLHIADGKLSNYIKHLLTDLNNGNNNYAKEKLEEIFDFSKDYLIVYNNLNYNDTNYIHNNYIIDNWKKIRKQIAIERLNTRNQIVEPLTFLNNQMNETQKKIVDWATIQARYQAYKSVSTGNTLNTDYFITCELKNDNDQTCDDDIKSVNTLIKLDNGEDNDEDINFYNLDNIINASLDYGFLIFDNIENPTKDNLKASSDNCNINIDDYEITNAISLTKLTNGTNNCRTTNSINSLVEDFNMFGFPIMFSNAKNSILNEEITIGNNRYPIDITEAPYNATLFTLLPNNELIVKKLYAHIF